MSAALFLGRSLWIKLAPLTRIHCAQKNLKLRMDAFLCVKLPDLSRSRIQECIKDGLVLVNESPQRKPSFSLKLGDAVVCGHPTPRVSAAEPEDIPLDVVFEDSSVLVVNKPAGTSSRVHQVFGMPSTAFSMYRVLIRQRLQVWWCILQRATTRARW